MCERICVILIISFVRNYKGRKRSREREEKGKTRGACETTIFPSLTFRLQFACANSKTHDCHTKLKCPFPFLPLPLPLRPLSLFALLFYLAWFYFILFHSLFILFHFIACGLCKQIPLSACWCCNWFISVSVSVFVFIFKAFAKVDNLLNAQVTAITVN